MGVSRDSITLIQNELSGTLLEIALTHDDDPEAGAEAIRQVVSASVWEALYTLANHIDDLRV
jgi:hypothetical protein